MKYTLPQLKKAVGVVVAGAVTVAATFIGLNMLHGTALRYGTFFIVAAGALGIAPAAVFKLKNAPLPTDPVVIPSVHPADPVIVEMKNQFNGLLEYLKAVEALIPDIPAAPVDPPAEVEPTITTPELNDPGPVAMLLEGPDIQPVEEPPTLEEVDVAPVPKARIKPSPTK